MKTTCQTVLLAAAVTGAAVSLFAGCATAPAPAPTESTSDEPTQSTAPPKKLSTEEVRQARLDAQVVAGTWLRQVDAADFAGSWESAASPLQNRVGKGEWTQGLTKARGGFGDLTRRHFLKTIYSNKLQPAGHHVVVNYHSQFANSPARESVTVFKDADGQWRVLMYGIEKTDAPPPAEEAPAETQDDAEAQP